MKVKIHGMEFEFHYSFRIYYLFENKIRKADKDAEEYDLPKPDLNSLESTIKLLWATLETTIRHNNADIILTEDDVLDIVDENGGITFINKFAEWFANAANAQMALAPEVDKNIKVKNSVKKK